MIQLAFWETVSINGLMAFRNSAVWFSCLDEMTVTSTPRILRFLFYERIAMLVRLTQLQRLPFRSVWWMTTSSLLTASAGFAIFPNLSITFCRMDGLRIVVTLSGLSWFGWQSLHFGRLLLALTLKGTSGKYREGKGLFGSQGERNSAPQNHVNFTT